MKILGELYYDVKKKYGMVKEEVGGFPIVKQILLKLILKVRFH